MSRPGGRAAVPLVPLVAVLAASGTASAHGVGSEGNAVGLTLVVGLAVGAGLVAGLVAVTRDGGGIGRTRLTALVGPTLVALGALAVATVAGRGPLVAGGCLLAGAALGWVLVRRVADGHASHGSCANTALGAVTVHRAVEGLSLAAVYATGSAVGLVGAVVLAGHATAETAAVGGLFGVGSRSRGVAAVGVVQAAFLAGAVAGVVATAELPPVLSDGTVAVVGGVLLVVGIVETVGGSPGCPDTP